MNITLNGTKITQDTRNLAFEKNNGVDEIVVTVDTDESWSYKLDVKYPDKYNVENNALYNIIDLDRNGNTCSVILTSGMLPFNGKYTMQLRGINGDKVYHSDIFEAWVKYSIEPGSTYNPVPSEFYQVEARLDDKVNEAKKYAENAGTASTRMPKISPDNTWLIWDVETGDYVDTGVKASGSNVDAKAREDISKLSEEKVDKSVLGLIVGADGKIYVAINGVAIGSGVEITGGTGEDTTYKVELSDGIILNTLMFQDEFDGDVLSSIWKPQIGQNEAAMNCVFSALSENIAVEDGKLRMTVLKNNPTSNYPYSGARILSQTFGGADNYDFDTGYAEIRFMVDNLAPGIAPAFWLTGQIQSEEYIVKGDYDATRNLKGLTWPWAGEIGAVEGFSDTEGFDCTPGMHYQQDPYISSQIMKTVDNAYRYIVGEWHTAGVYKSKDVLKFYFDRTLVGTLDISDNECFSGAGFKIILNLATGSTWGGETPADFSESNMYVDYVRVYSLSNSMTTLAEQNTESLLPDCAGGFACVAGRSWILRPEFALNTQNTALYWESDNTAIAKVENGYVTTVANGVCNIIAKDVNGNTVINFALTVKDNAGIVATGIKVTSSVEGINANSSAEITANIYPTNCDSLTPTLTVISGADYCTIDGTTISNINTSGENQEIVVRVSTNNPSVYEDITITLLSAIDYSVTPSTNLLANYNVDGMSNYNVGGVANGVKWADSLGFGNTLVYTSGAVTFTGLALSAGNALWNFNTANNKPMTTDIPEAYTIMLMANMSGLGTPVEGADGIYMSSATNMRLIASANHNLTVPEYQGVDCVFAITWENGIANAYTMVGDPETIYSITEKASAAVTSADISGLYVICAGTHNGFAGSVYQALLFDAALDVDSIKNYAAQMFAKN